VIFRRDGSLFAQALAYAPLALQGRPVLAADNAPLVSFLPRQPLAVATSTLLAYRTGTQVSQQFTWFGRDGRRLGTIGPEGTFSTFDLARDGARLVVSRIESVGMNLWVLDTGSGAFNRVTSGPSTDLDPRASADGRVVVFGSTRDPARSPFRSSLNGQDPSERVFPFSGQVYSNDDWSADGRWLLYHDASVPVLYARRMDQTGEPPAVAARAIAGIIDQARMSRDGRWIAYNSTESGRSEVYVVPFPPTGERWQVSAAGGVQPMWGPRDRELYYLSLAGTLMAVPVRSGDGLDVGRAVRLFQSPLRSVSGDTEQYAVAPDGSRFLFAPSTAPAKPDVVTILTNWRAIVSQRAE
jgi:Tol biopolymer transport system component